MDAACPRSAEVQERTDRAADTVRREGNYWTPSQYGTAVHKNLQRQFDGLRDPDFRAEVSVLKSNDARYGAAGSVRIDVLENPHNDSICVYDIKTGRSRLSPARMLEIASEVQRYYGFGKRIIGTETRPGR